MSVSGAGPTWDVEVVILGGGSAGLSAALTLSRARRSVVVIDGGAPRNAPAAAAHGLLGQEGIAPLSLLAAGRAEAGRYGAVIVPSTVIHAEGVEGGFVVDLANGARARAGQVLIATGVRDELPAIDGLAQRWGRDVVHCPYCHGWEIRDQRIGLLATGPMSPMQALLFRQWSEQLWFFPGELQFPADELERLAAMGITVVPGLVEGLDVDGDRLAGIRLRDKRISLDAVAVPTLTEARLEGLDGLDLRTERNAMGTALAADPTGRTSTPGVWAAGNVVNAAMQVSESAANGARVAMTINTELVLAEASAASAVARADSERGR